MGHGSRVEHVGDDSNDGRMLLFYKNTHNSGFLPVNACIPVNALLIFLC